MFWVFGQALPAPVPVLSIVVGGRPKRSLGCSLTSPRRPNLQPNHQMLPSLQGMNPLGMPGAPPPPPHMAGPLSLQQQLAQQQLAAQQLGAQQFMAPGQQQLDFSNFYYGGGMYYQ